jgi:hypothetical protein
MYSSPTENVKISQSNAFRVQWQHHKLAQACPCKPGWPISVSQQVADQQLLAPFVRFSEKLLPYGAEIVIGLARKCIAKVLSKSDTTIDQLGAEMIEQLNFYVLNPGNFSH